MKLLDYIKFRRLGMDNGKAWRMAALPSGLDCVTFVLRGVLALMFLALFYTVARAAQ